MVDAKLLPGRFLNFVRPAWRDLTGQPPVFENVTCPPLTIEESKKSHGQRASNVVAGTNTKKIWRNFKFLPWYQGDIAETELDCDVITGPMSGCVLTSYRRGPNLMVGHVGTVTVTDAVPKSINDAVKNLWNQFALVHAADVIGGFNPVDRSVPAHPRAEGDDSGGVTWGLLTTTGEYYSLQVYSQRSNANRYRIAAVHRVQSMSLHQLQRL